MNRAMLSAFLRIFVILSSFYVFVTPIPICHSWNLIYIKSIILHTFRSFLSSLWSDYDSGMKWNDRSGIPVGSPL